MVFINWIGDINFSSPKAPHKVLRTLWGSRYRQTSLSASEEILCACHHGKHFAKLNPLKINIPYLFQVNQKFLLFILPW